MTAAKLKLSATLVVLGLLPAPALRPIRRWEASSGPSSPRAKSRRISPAAKADSAKPADSTDKPKARASVEAPPSGAGRERLRIAEEAIASIRTEIDSPKVTLGTSLLNQYQWPSHNGSRSPMRLGTNSGGPIRAHQQALRR